MGEQDWGRGEKFVGISSWGLNGGLLLMVVTNLFPGGVLQRLDVLQHSYWHARRHEFVAQGLMHTIEWLRLPADALCIGLDGVPMVVATGLTCRAMSANPPRPVGSRGRWQPDRPAAPKRKFLSRSPAEVSGRRRWR